MATNSSRIVLFSTAVVLALVWSADGESPNSVSAQTTEGVNRPAVTSDPVDGYMALAPSVLRSGQTEPISVSLFSGQKPARGTVKLRLYNKTTLLAEAEGNIEGTDSIPLTVPRTSQGDYYLSIVGPGFQEFKSVMVDSGDVLFVETDKPVYNPGQDMRIRVLLLDVELKPLSGDVTVEVQDAKDIKIFREHLRNALEAVRWLVSQRNAYGGYRSTQDTVVGLQALIQHSIVTQNNVDMTVTLTSGDWSEQVTIEAANADIVQVVKVPVGEDIQVAAEGGGEAVLQVVHRFNRPEAQAQPVEIFTLDVDYSPDLVTVGDVISVSAKVGFVPPSDLDVGMVVLDIAVPTGFSHDVDTLETMANDNPMIRRYDITERHVVIYLEDLVANETFNLNFAAKAQHVITTQPATSRVYSYYNPRWRAESLGPSVTVEEVSEITQACIAVVADETNVGLVSDCEALLEARDILAVNASLNWSGDTPISDWEGVTLQGTPQRVTRLELSDMGLDGSVPAELGQLSRLSYLDLRDNGLSGPMSPELGDLTNLRYLYLHGNSLDGEIPSRLGNMTNLRYLWLHTNDLTGEIPEELGDLENLRDLNLHTNKLSGAIPGELGDLTSLTRLRLHRNELSGTLPKELGNMSSLKFLWLHGNDLTGEIPSELGNLDALQRIYLSENRLGGNIPAELNNLSDTLTHWRLAGNRLTGCVPAKLVGVGDNDFDSLGLDACADS